MPILNRIVLILCVHILAASVLRTNSQHTALPPPPPALMLRRELHDRLNPEHSSTPLVPETTASKGSQIDPGDDRYKEFTHSHSVRQLAHWTGRSPNATFHLCSVFNFLLMLALIYWKGYCPSNCGARKCAQRFPWRARGGHLGQSDWSLPQTSGYCGANHGRQFRASSSSRAAHDRGTGVRTACERFAFGRFSSWTVNAPRPAEPVGTRYRRRHCGTGVFFAESDCSGCDAGCRAVAAVVRAAASSRAFAEGRSCAG